MAFTRSSLAAVVAITFVTLVCCDGAQELAPGSGSWPGADLFSDGAICQVRIETSSRDLEHLRREPRAFVRANVTERGTLYQDVAVHLKGSVGSFRPLDDKPGFTLDFATFRPAQRFHGLRRVHLNNSVEDPSYCSEQLGSELFRSAGIPAPRVSRAVVTVNERKPGLYVLKEGFTEDFLSCYFKTAGGNLFEPGEGHDVNQHLKRIAIRAPVQDRAALKALAEAASEPDPNRRWKRVGTVLELDRFIRFMALEVMLGHRDGYCLARNNYRIYQDFDTGKLVFLPHGMDQLFGAADLPWMPHMAGLVAQALLTTPEGKEQYSAAFREIFKTLLNPEALAERVNQAIAPLGSVIGPSEFGGIRSEAASLNQRILQRHRYLESELSQTPTQALDLSSGFARLVGWARSDEPASGRMQEGAGADGVNCLEIMTRAKASSSWRTKALVGPGRYRFEGKVRVDGVQPLGFGAHQGAGLRIRGQPRQSEDLTGTSAWRVLSTQFQTKDLAQEVEFVCELRASAGEAWFDCASLRVVQEK